jgi:hypothetical protein
VAHKFRWGNARCSPLSRKAAAIAACSLLAVVGGCGAEEGVGENATVTVYAAATACSRAQAALEREGGRAGALRVGIRCLAPVRRDGRFDLAAVGANARRATEDSTTVAYIGGTDPVANRFSRPILEEAEIPLIAHRSGAASMAAVLRALRMSDAESLRERVSEGR